jgi:tetratricopeptide (TPR) repeat protein
MEQLGEEEEPLSAAKATAERLAATSLLEELEYRDAKGRHLRRYMLHPSTVEFIRLRFGDTPDLRQKTHLRVGTFLEEQARESPYIDVDVEAGWHLFQAGEYDRSNELLGPASVWLQDHGRVREGLAILLPFLEPEARSRLERGRLARSLGTAGIAYHRLGEVRKAIEYYEEQFEIVREIGDQRGEGAALGNLGNAHAGLGDRKKAKLCLEQALAIGRQVEDPEIIHKCEESLKASEGN